MGEGCYTIGNSEIYERRLFLTCYTLDVKSMYNDVYY